MKLPLSKSCPRLRGKCRGVSRDERGITQSSQAVLLFPLSRLRRQLPRSTVAPFCAPYNLSRSHAVRRILHGAAIFHIAIAIFHPFEERISLRAEARLASSEAAHVGQGDGESVYQRAAVGGLTVGGRGDGAVKLALYALRAQQAKLP